MTDDLETHKAKPLRFQGSGQLRNPKSRVDDLPSLPTAYLETGFFHSLGARTQTIGEAQKISAVVHPRTESLGLGETKAS
jgi:hypothetical protein